MIANDTHGALLGSAGARENVRQMSMQLATFTICLLLGPSLLRAQSPPPVYEGFTEPRYDIMVAATEIGRLEEVLVEVGDYVQQGQTLARLEDSLQASALKIAELQAEMHGEIDAAQAEVFLHRTRRDSIRKLAMDNSSSPIELTRAESDLKIAQAREVGAREQQELRKAELERYKLQHARRRVTAPMSGVVAKVFHRPGEYITPADAKVIRLLVVDQIFAVFNVPADELAAIKLGADVRVFSKSTSQTIPGRVHSIAPDIHAESQTVQIKVQLDNTSGDLRVGDRCTMQLGRGSKSRAQAALLDSYSPIRKSR